MPRDDMSAEDKLGATEDYMEAYYRGLRVGHAEASMQLAEWMIAHSFATGHGDTMRGLLSELTWQIDELRMRSSNAP